MLNRIRRWFRPRWPRSRRIAVPSYSIAQKRVMLATLADHAGWRYLMAELEHKKFLQESMRDDLTRRIDSKVSAEALTRELIRIDEACHWLGFISDVVRRAGAMPDLAALDAREREAVETRP